MVHPFIPKQYGHSQKKELPFRLEFDFIQTRQQRWKVSKIYLPPHKPQDALAVADHFLLALLNWNFPEAKKCIDTDRVNDERIAALCILFEEGKFRTAKENPLHVKTQREDIAWVIARLRSTTLQTISRFGLEMENREDQPWKITGINLDDLLADYIRKQGEGDPYYSPLIKNPQGGDLLVLYFSYDKYHLHPRAQRQLEIISQMLNTDRKKKIHIGGHADAKGTDHYNASLSAKRAQQVRNTLLNLGVLPEQVKLKSFGSAKPLQPNLNPDGSDNPTGRRFNRRAEIFLDF